MKRKRDDHEEAEHRPKRRRISIRSKVLSLSNFLVLNDFLGEFCIEVPEMRAVREADCSTCHHQRDYENLPSAIQESIKNQGYLTDALVRELYHRNPDSRVLARPNGILFQRIKHIPWLAVHIVLFRSTQTKIHLDMDEGLTIEWALKAAEPDLNSFVKDFIGKIEDLSLKKSLSEFMK